MLDAVISSIEKIPQSVVASGVLGSFVLGAAVYSLKALPRYVLTLARRCLFRTLFFNNCGTYDQQCAFQAAAQHLDDLEPNLRWSGVTSPALRSRYDSRGAKKSLLGPAVGHLYSVKVLGGTVFFKLQADGYSQYGQANMSLCIYVPIWRNLEEVSDELTGMNELTVHFCGKSHSTLRAAPKPLDTCIHADGVVESLVSTIQEFLESKDKYTRHGNQHKLVILLHGPYGTGKTSIIAGLASHFRQDLTMIDMEAVEPRTLLRYCTSGFMALEEVNNLSVAVRDDVEVRGTTTSDTVNRALFWQWLSGNVPHNSSVIFMTTNHIEQLHDGMLRDARVDLQLFIGRWGVEELVRYLHLHLDLDHNHQLRNQVYQLRLKPDTPEEQKPAGSAVKAILDSTPAVSVLPALLEKYPALYLP